LQSFAQYFCFLRTYYAVGKMNAKSLIHLILPSTKIDAY